MDSWNKLDIDRMHAQLINSFSELTPVVKSKAIKGSRKKTALRLLLCACVHVVGACVCEREKHILHVFIHTVRPPTAPKGTPFPLL